jgi:branched-chain amino acid transport system ATP-binding protein
MGYCGKAAAKEACVMALLEADNITKCFGGLIANDSISFEVKRNELLGLIGPNGAGKTTLFNCIAGAHRIDSGRIIFDGKDITKLNSYEIARLGLARTFQIYVASGDLNVLENVMVGCFMRTSSTAKAKSMAEAVLKELELTDIAQNMMNELPVAVQKRVTMATALGTSPKLLLLDEVAAGLNPSEIENIMTVIRYIHEKMGITVVLIEHVMEMVMKLSQRVIVLDYGKKIAEGEPASVVRHPDVIRAYLGERYAREYAESSADQ